MSFTALNPSAAPSLGGTRVTVYGKWSPAPGNASCEFADSVGGSGVRASAVASWSGSESNRTLVCPVPALLYAQHTTVTVRGDQGDAVVLPFAVYGTPRPRSW